MIFGEIIYLLVDKPVDICYNLYQSVVPYANYMLFLGRIKACSHCNKRRIFHPHIFEGEHHVSFLICCVYFLFNVCFSHLCVCVCAFTSFLHTLYFNFGFFMRLFKICFLHLDVVIRIREECLWHKEKSNQQHNAETFNFYTLCAVLTTDKTTRYSSSVLCLFVLLLFGRRWWLMIHFCPQLF